MPKTKPDLNKDSDFSFGGSCFVQVWKQPCRLSNKRMDSGLSSGSVPRQGRMEGWNPNNVGWMMRIGVEGEGEALLWGSTSPVSCQVLLLEGIDTWLILPVVICLSQRLSHACLSINEIIQ